MRTIMRDINEIGVPLSKFGKLRSVSQLDETLSELMKYVQEHYLEIDLEEMGKKAWIRFTDLGRNYDLIED
jgi:hypothetical protein